MKKFFTPEVKIACVAIVGIILLFFGMQFLKGLSLFSSSDQYDLKFNDISGLSASSPVNANGFKVGTVKSIDYDYNKPGNITVHVDLNKGMRVPEGTTAEIVSDLMGNVQVKLIMPSEIKEFLHPGGVIDGRINDGALGEAKSMVPAIKQMLPKLDSILASVNMLLADPALKGSLHNVHKITTDLTTSTKELNALLAQINVQVPALTGNANALLANANSTMKSASGMVTNANQFMTKLNGVDINGTMAKVNTTLTNVQELTDRINSGKGSLGLLINDPVLYNNLNTTVRSADSLVTDLKAHPKRYVHFSVFGKKDK